MNKDIYRDNQGAGKIFDSRSLANDYRTLIPVLQTGMHVLDVGCGTGAITKDIANAVGKTGKVIGIDNTETFITSGRETHAAVPNMELRHVDLFDYEPDQPFDLIVSARVLQWLNNPKEALTKMYSLLKPGGIVSILDYNHWQIEWDPAIPESMRSFYMTFLKWRADAGMDNEIADNLPGLLETAGFTAIETFHADEHYDRSRPDFPSKVSIWSNVAGSKQMVEEGYLDNALRLQAIEEYNHWVENEAVSMTLKLNEVRGRK